MLVVCLQDEQLALTPDAGEGAPVQWTRAPAIERREVLRGRVALVAGGDAPPETPPGLCPQTVARGPLGARRPRGPGAARAAPPPGVLRPRGMGPGGADAGV